MQATLIADASNPVEFVVRDDADQVVRMGWSQLWPVRPDPTSGQTVHLLDFTGLAGENTSYRVEAVEQQSHRFPVGSQLYRDLSREALRFFYLMRSGTPIEETLAPGYGRPAGHVGRAPNSGDDAVPTWMGLKAEQLYPGWHDDGRYDVSGGWYDAGDYGKYVTSGAIAVWQLLSTLDLLDRRSRSEETDAQAATIRQECRWQLDWLLTMQVPPGRPLAGLAFHRVHGTVWSPLPGWAHLDPLIESYTALPPGQRCTWPPQPLTAPDCCGAATRRTPTGSCRRRRPPTTPPADTPTSLLRTTTPASVAAPTATTSSTTTSTGRRPSCGWPPATTPTELTCSTLPNT